MHYEGKRISWLKTVGGVEKTLRFLIIIKKDKSLLNYMLKKWKATSTTKVNWHVDFCFLPKRMVVCLSVSLLMKEI